MRITQKELGERLGLSRQIVARVLNGNPHVNPAARQRVLHAAQELGYTAQSNMDARNLIARRYGAKARKNALAVLMPGYEGVPMRKVPYYVPILDGLETEANQRVLDISLHALPNGVVPRYVSDFMVDGVVAFTSTPERNEWMHSHGLPVVFIDGRDEDFSRIYSDHVSGITQCTQHLIDLGHTRIAYFGFGGSEDYSTTLERFGAFTDTLANNGLSLDSRLNWRHASPRMLRDPAAGAMTQILADNPSFTAVVCYNDLLALGVIDALRANGLRVPRDVSVTGFDNVSESYGPDMHITSVTFDREEMGREAIRMLYTMVEPTIVDGSATPEVLERILPVEFVVRSSTGPRDRAESYKLRFIR